MNGFVRFPSIVRNDDRTAKLVWFEHTRIGCRPLLRFHLALSRARRREDTRARNPRQERQELVRRRRPWLPFRPKPRVKRGFAAKTAILAFLMRNPLFHRASRQSLSAKASMRTAPTRSDDPDAPGWCPAVCARTHNLSLATQVGTGPTTGRVAPRAFALGPVHAAVARSSLVVCAAPGPGTLVSSARAVS